MEFDHGQTPTIAVVNEATTPFPVALPELVAALQTYVDNFLGPAWGVACNLKLTNPITSGMWAIVFTDDADQAGALGYHDLTPDGLPLSHVFVKTTLDDGEKVEVTASHELAEMLVDPGIQMGAFGFPTHNRKGGGNHCWCAYEVCDAVEETSFPVHGIEVSNFVFPSWFEGFRTSGKFDQLDQCTKPFQLLTGGYMPIFTNGGWTQVFGSTEAGQKWKKDRHPRCDLRQRKHRGRVVFNSQLAA